jgi:hypothetical protein
MNIEAGRNQSPTDQHFLAGSLCLGSIRKLVTRWVSAGRARCAPRIGRDKADYHAASSADAAASQSLTAPQDGLAEECG